MEQKDQKYKFKQIEIRLKVKEGESLYSTEPVNCPEAAVKLLADYMKDMDRECVYVLHFDTAMRPISFHLTSMGGSNYAPIDPANIFKSAMLTNASNIMIMHVHPSGSLKPSNADIEGTEKLALLGNLLNVPVRDHLIVGGGSGSFISLKAEMPEIFHYRTNTPIVHEDKAQEGKAEEGKAGEVKEGEGRKKESIAEPTLAYDPLALTLDQKEILFTKEAPEAMELAKALESLGNENAGTRPSEGDKARQEWLLGTAKDIKAGKTENIIKAVSDMSETTENIAVAKKAVDFLIKLEAVREKWESSPKEIVKAFEQKDTQNPEKAKDPAKSEIKEKTDKEKIDDKNIPFSQKLEAAKQKADAINASRASRHMAR